jgi:hypothetical protein
MEGILVYIYKLLDKANLYVKPKKDIKRSEIYYIGGSE